MPINLPGQAQSLALRNEHRHPEFALTPDPVLQPSTNRTAVSASEQAILPELSALPLDHTTGTAGTGISLPYQIAREHLLLGQGDALSVLAPPVLPTHTASFPSAVPLMSSVVPTTESAAIPTAGYSGGDDARQYAPVPGAHASAQAQASKGAGGVLDSAAINTACTVGKEALASLTSQGYGGLIERQQPTAKPGQWIPIEDLEDKKDQGIIGALLQIVEAQTMLDHWEAFGNAEHGVRWDAPPVLLTGREAMRCMVYWAKSVADMTFDVTAFKKEGVDVNKGIEKLHLQVVFHVMPKGIMKLGLPKHIPIKADIAATVVRDRAEPMDSPGRIQSIWGRWHNMFILPWPMRSLTAVAMGHFLHATEAIWSPVLQYPPFFDDSYLHHGLGKEKPL